MSPTWHYDKPKDGLLRVRINREDRPVNALSRQALEELDALIREAASDANVKGIVFFSGKRGNFIAGADVTELKDLAGTDAARELSQFGQRVFQDLADLGKPTVALISGACLGGGLEFALACRYRIADAHRNTLLGLPEVKLGLIPGWGGTVRLPRLIGLTEALPMILTGKLLNGYQARSRGLVDDVVPNEALQSVGERVLRECIASGSAAKLFRPRRKPLWKRGVEQRRSFQKLALRTAEKQVRAKTHGHYPAPFKAIEALRQGLTGDKQAGFVAESEAVAQLAEHPVTRELIRLFFLQEEAKKPPADLADLVESNALQGVAEFPRIRAGSASARILGNSVTNPKAAVVGAGAMGAGIALLLAKSGVWTRLKDLNPDLVARGMQTIRKLVKGDVDRRRMTPLDATAALDHLSPTTDYRGLKHADLVIEAIVEDLEIKRRVFRELAEATSPNTVLATNTSSLLVKEIARDVPHPERVVGLHFFNPPHQMPLVEVVHTDDTSPEALATAIAAVQRLGKTKVVVRDCAGFLVNRLLAPYMNEAGYLIAEVADPLEIDRAAVAFGMPMGPLELTDLVGLDVAAHVAENMHAAYGERMAPAPLWQALKEARGQQKGRAVRLIERRWRGRRLNRNVARVLANVRKQQGQARPRTPLSQQVIIERLIYPIINEAALCLEEGIVARADELDLAMVFGTGFAPFRGGPMRYADAVGVGRVVETLEAFAQEHPRLAPSGALRQLADESRGVSPRSPERHAPAL